MNFLRNATLAFSLLSPFSLSAMAQPVVLKHHNSEIRSVELTLPKRTADNEFLITDFGAKGDGKTLDREPLQTAIDTAEKAGGGYVIVPAGQYLIGGVVMKSNVYLVLEKHAELIASDNPEHFKVWPGQEVQYLPGLASKGNQVDEHNRGVRPEYHWNVIGGYSIKNTGILGEGVINGMGNENYVSYYSDRDDRFEPIKWTVDNCKGECRPQLVKFNRSENIFMQGVTLTNNPRWILHFKGSQNILVDGIRIDGDLRMPNNDGIDVDSSRNVTIRNAYISTADDGICLKSSQGYGIIDNLLVEDTVIRSKSSAIKVGSNVDEDMKNAYFRNIRIFDSNRGIGFQQVGYQGGGDVYDFTYENIDIETSYKANRWWGNGEPIWMISMPRRVGAQVGRTYNIAFKDITAISEHGILIAGREGTPIENITFDNVHVFNDLWSEYRWPIREYTAGMYNDGERVLSGVDGVYLEHVKDVTWHDSSITFFEPSQDYYRDCYRQDDVNVQNVKGLACNNADLTQFFRARDLSKPLN